MPEASAAQAPRGEVAVLVAVQAALGDRPGALPVARALSHFGEHSIGWVAVAVTVCSTLFVWRTDFSPLWVLVAGAIIGALVL